MKLYTAHLSPHIAALDAEAVPLVEMNTTPLIDVLLVLIVMLIITIPVPLHRNRSYTMRFRGLLTGGSFLRSGSARRFGCLCGCMRTSRGAGFCLIA